MAADDPRSDLELIADINGGDDAAFEALYYRYRDWVVRLAHRLTGNADDALDVMQDTFAYVARKFPGFRLTAAMTSFLYPVVKNLSIAARRKGRRFASDEHLLNSIPAPADQSAGAQRTELAEALAALPEAHREVLLMRYVDDLSLQEIADALAIPLGTVKSRLHHATESLRQSPAARRFFEPA